MRDSSVGRTAFQNQCQLLAVFFLRQLLPRGRNSNMVPPTCRSSRGKSSWSISVSIPMLCAQRDTWKPAWQGDGVGPGEPPVQVLGSLLTLCYPDMSLPFPRPICLSGDWNRLHTHRVWRSSCRVMQGTGTCVILLFLMKNSNFFLMLFYLMKFLFWNNFIFPEKLRK